MTDDARLDLEFAYTTHADSCKAPWGVAALGSLIYCRRPYGHHDDHAAGYGMTRRRWDDTVAWPAADESW